MKSVSVENPRLLKYLNSPGNFLRAEKYTGSKDGSCYLTWLRMVLVMTPCHMLCCTVIHFFMPLENTLTIAKGEVILNVKAHIKRYGFLNFF